MQVIVPFASALAEGAQAAIDTLELPRLRALLARAAAPQRDDGHEGQLSMPHERALARAIGLAGADGCLPWAALAAAEAGIDTAGLAWGLLQPVHWRVGNDDVGLLDPAALALADDESRALFDAVRPLYLSEGCVLEWLDATRWLLAHESLRELPTAAIERAIGRGVEPWLARSAHPLLQRLHAEVQMVWYREPVNDARAARGEWPVNALWLSGCGAHQRHQRPAGLQLDARLRASALAGDWARWCEQWRALDAELLPELAARGGTLVLCGERSDVQLAPGGGLWSRVRAAWGAAPVAPLLRSL